MTTIRLLPRNNRAVPLTVQAVVSDGFITLDGTVNAIHRRLAAECAVKSMACRAPRTTSR